jgi:mRNA interferase MazF
VGLKRGDIITVALQGDLGKPRPAVVVESDMVGTTRHVLICPGTSHLVENAEPRRVLIMPEGANGLRLPTQFQADKIYPVRREKCGPVIGRLEPDAMARLTMQLGVLLGMAD